MKLMGHPPGICWSHRESGCRGFAANRNDRAAEPRRRDDHARRIVDRPVVRSMPAPARATRREVGVPLPAMRPLLLALLLLVSAGADVAGEAGFAPTLPDSVGDVSGWELVSGSFETPGFRGDYRFYVNPERQALYQLMRFRTATAGGSGAPLDAEKVAFVPRPSMREPMLCWRRQPPGRVPQWRLLEPGSDEYVAEMTTLIRVIAIHRAAVLDAR